MSDLTLVVTDSGADAALFDGDNRIDCGHLDSVSERLIERLGVVVEYVPSIVTDNAARGWSGVAKTLQELELK